MSIGETLADAREQAGLSVLQVSERTRIRPSIIRNIEADDYSECGGDFYARGDIRSIAEVVGADPMPLIQEYDRAYRAPGPVSATSLDELMRVSAKPERPRRGRAGWWCWAWPWWSQPVSRGSSCGATTLGRAAPRPWPRTATPALARPRAGIQAARPPPVPRPPVPRQARLPQRRRPPPLRRAPARGR